VWLSFYCLKEQNQQQQVTKYCKFLQRAPAINGANNLHLSLSIAHKYAALQPVINLISACFDWAHRAPVAATTEQGRGRKKFQLRVHAGSGSCKATILRILNAVLLSLKTVGYQAINIGCPTRKKNTKFKVKTKFASKPFKKFFF
jgi:hypothetical protein